MPVGPGSPGVGRSGQTDTCTDREDKIMADTAQDVAREIASQQHEAIIARSGQPQGGCGN